MMPHADSVVTSEDAPRRRTRRRAPPPAPMKQNAPELDAMAKIVVQLVATVPMGRVLDVIRNAMIEEALSRKNGNVAQAARALGVYRQALAKTLKRTATTNPGGAA